MIALAYYSPPTQQQIDAAESVHREGAVGSLIARVRSAASSIAAPGCIPTRAVEQRHGAGGVPAHTPSAPCLAALYVATDGVYFGRDDVDPWDEQRDARTYAGPYPVVAHPPCARWSPLAYLNQARHGYKVGDDGGCFAAALEAVRRYGGVLEHPAHSVAWEWFGLPSPIRQAWTTRMHDPGWSTEVSQSAYGHRARKRTWIYYVGAADPPALNWADPEGECIVSDLHAGESPRDGRGDRPRMYQREALSTPPAFAEALLSLARVAR